MKYMETKLGKLKKLFYAGDLQGALRIAARFPVLGEEETAIKRAHESFHNERFYKQLGHDISTLREQGRLALVSKYSL